jgi:hypothetical protein
VLTRGVKTSYEFVRNKIFEQRENDKAMILLSGISLSSIIVLFLK